MKNATRVLFKGYKNTFYPLLVLLLGWLPSSCFAQVSYSNNNGIAYHGLAQRSVAASGVAAGVTFSLSSAPGGVTINSSTGQISWDATVAVGSYQLGISASDGSNTGYFLQVIPNPDDFVTPKFSGSTVKTVYYATPNNSFHDVDVYLPNGDNNTQRPVFVFQHGGGFRAPSGGSGTKTESYVVTFCQYMATCGYVAFAPDYNEKSGHTLAQNLLAVQDMDACVNWIRNSTTASTYNYNPNFIFVGGGSAGGHLSCNYVNYDGDPNYGGYKINLTGVIAEADCWGSSPPNDRLYSYSSIKSTQIPTLIVHGSKDATVNDSVAINLDKVLTAAGAYHDFWLIAGESHGCPNHRAAISDTMAHFQNRAWKHLFPQTINDVVALPIKLANFEVTAVANKVTINWRSATETNTDHFDIERSIDGQNFSMIGRKASIGNSSIIHNYSFVDANVVDGSIYYRLKTVDKNGLYTYSGVKTVQISTAKSSISKVYPNPFGVGHILTVVYSSQKGDKATFQLTNTIGQKLNTTTFPVHAGSNTLSISIGQLPPGIYYLSAFENSQSIQRIPLTVK